LESRSRNEWTEADLTQRPDRDLDCRSNSFWQVFGVD
jgi:hypothetical protein